MSRPRNPEKTWYAAAADKIVRGGLTLRQAANELDIPLSIEDADKLSKTKTWQDVLWAARHKYQTEIANVPGRSKTSLVGLSYLLIQDLIKQGDFDKALDGIQKLARLEGWDKSAEVNIFAGVTSADIDAQRKLIEKELLEHQSAGSTEPSRPN